MDQQLRAYSRQDLESMQKAGMQIYQMIQSLTCFGMPVQLRQLSSIGLDANRSSIYVEKLNQGSEVIPKPSPTAKQDNLTKDNEDYPKIILDKFKNQQIQILGSVKTKFNEKQESRRTCFSIAPGEFEVVIHFDQTERLAALHFDLQSGPELKVQAFRYQEFNKFSPLDTSMQIDSGSTKTIEIDPKRVQFGLGLKIIVGNPGPSIAELELSIEVYENYYASQIRIIDQSGLLKAASSRNPYRKDEGFITANINSGLILEILPDLAKDSLIEDGSQLFPTTIPRKTNLIEEPIKNGITMYVHLMNRNQNVVENLSNWLAQSFDELIFLDWSSEDAVSDIPGILEDPRVRVVRVNGQKKFVRTLAQNLASQMARYRCIFKCDSDVLIKGKFFKAHPLNQGEFWVGDWHHGRNHNERHLHGETFYHVDDYFRVQGYDERIIAYGQDDTNLKDRMVLAGLVKKVFDYNFLHHIPHPQTDRTTNQDMIHPMVKTYENRLATCYAELWSPRFPLKTYQNIQIMNDQLITLELKDPIDFTIDPELEIKAIDIVASWYMSNEKMKIASKDEKISKIWEMQHE